MTISPKLLVSDWTTTIAMEKMAWVRPEGNPSLIKVREWVLLSFSMDQLRSKASFILSNFSKQRTAEIPWAITVAKATPETPMLNLATNKMSSPTLSVVEISKKTRADKESPKPRNIPARILKKAKPAPPRKNILR